MKHLLIILSATLLFSCRENKTTEFTSEKDSPATSSPQITDSLKAATGDSSVNAVPANKLIIPGKSIGLTALGQSTEEIMKNLGRPDDGDAAMGKSLNTWHSKNNPQYKTQVFSSMRNGEEGDYPRVKSIRINNPFFETSAGLKPGSNLKEILAAYPALLLSGSYKNAEGKNVRLYDDSEKGIAFEIDENDTCIGICVHIAGEKAFAQYLPFEQSFTSTDN